MSSSALEDLGPEHALLVHLRVDGARTPARVRLTVGPDLRLALLSSDGRLVHLVRTCLVDVEAYRRTASAAPLLIQRLPEGRSWPGETEPGGRAGQVRRNHRGRPLLQQSGRVLREHGSVLRQPRSLLCERQSVLWQSRPLLRVELRRRRPVYN